MADLEELEMPVRSKYLLLDDETYELLASRTDIQPVGALPIGQLCYNLDSGRHVKPNKMTENNCKT